MPWCTSCWRWKERCSRCGNLLHCDAVCWVWGPVIGWRPLHLVCLKVLRNHGIVFDTYWYYDSHAGRWRLV